MRSFGLAVGYAKPGSASVNRAGPQSGHARSRLLWRGSLPPRVADCSALSTPVSSILSSSPRFWVRGQAGPAGQPGPVANGDESGSGSLVAGPAAGKPAVSAATAFSWLRPHAMAERAARVRQITD